MLRRRRPASERTSDWTEEVEQSEIRCFVSYASKDRQFVDRLTEDLTSSRLRLWVDKQKIGIGDSVPRRISRALSTVDAFLLVLSPESVASSWVAQELDAALIREIDDHDVRIVPLLVRDCTIPALLRSRKYIDFRQSYSSAIIQLVDGIHEVMTRRTTSVSDEYGAGVSIPFDRVSIPFDRLEEDDKDAPSPIRAQDETIALTSGTAPTVRLTVIFETTGERYHVLLPQDLRCELAARRIIAAIFLEDLPWERRSFYLRNGVFYLAKRNDSTRRDTGVISPSPHSVGPRGSLFETPGYSWETLRQANIGNGDEVLVLSAIPYPWVHNAAAAGLLMKRGNERYERDATFRCEAYVIGAINQRLSQHGLYGLSIY